MGSFNGHLATLIKGSSTGGENAVLTGVSTVTVGAIIPAKFMKRAQFAIRTRGLSGSYAAHIFGSIGGVTFVIAGSTGVAANNSVIIGATAAIAGVARPVYVQWSSAVNGAGFTSSVFMAGDY